MRVLRIRIQNIMGVESLEFEPGKLTVIEGANETGKTSAVRAMQALMENAPTVKVLRAGEQQGEIAWVLDNGDEITRKYEEGKPTGELVVKRGGYAIKKPQTYLDSILGLLNVDPIAFVFGTKEERGRVLLQALPLRVSEEEIKTAVHGLNIPPVDLSRHALTVIDELADMIYDARTEENRVVKDKGTLIEQLGASLPPNAASLEPVGNVNDEWARLDALQQGARERAAAEQTEIRQKYERLAEEVNAEARTTVAGYNEEIQALRMKIKELEAARQNAEVVARSKVAELQVVRDHEIQYVVSNLAGVEQEHRRKRTEVFDKANQYLRVQATLTNIKQAQEAYDVAKGRAERATAALAGLEELKDKKLDELPIPGVEFREGEIYYNGLPWESLNRQKQFEMAVRLAARVAGDLPFIVVDNFEALDADHFAAFSEEVKKLPGDVQVVLARAIAGKPLTVETS